MSGKELYYALFLHFMEQSTIYSNLISNRETKHFREYEDMLVHKVTGRSGYSEKEKTAIEHSLGQDLYELLDNTKGKLDRYGYIRELYKREGDSLLNIGLSQIMPIDMTEIVDRTFSEGSFKANAKTEQIAINLFWINKYWKILQNSKLSFWLSDTHEQFGNGNSKISDDSKYLTIMRAQILDYIQRRVDIGCKNITFEEFILALYEKRGELPETRRLQIARERMKSVEPEILQEYLEVEKKYNQCFGEKNEIGGQFLTDCLYNLYMLKEKQNVQGIKDILTRQLVELLIIDKTSQFTTNYPSWGVVKDKREQGIHQQILYMDIPGYIKPLQVHIPDKLISDGEGHIPTYKGIYANRDEDKIISTNFLFKVSQEQAKTIKKKMKLRKQNYKKHPRRTEQEIVKTLEYMSAIANREIGKLLRMGEDEER